MTDPDLQSLTNFRRLSDRLITSGQPTEDQLAAVARAGVEVVINLALHNAPYSLSDEHATVEGLGMTYEHIPVIWEQPTRADLDAFFVAMDRYATCRVFVHCAANYRASAFIMLYRVRRLGWRIEDALPEVRAIWDPAQYPAWQAFLEETLRGAKDLPDS